MHDKPNKVTTNLFKPFIFSLATKKLLHNGLLDLDTWYDYLCTDFFSLGGSYIIWATLVFCSVGILAATLRLAQYASHTGLHMRPNATFSSLNISRLLVDCPLLLGGCCQRRQLGCERLI